MKNILVALLFVCAPIASFAESIGTFAVEAKPVDQYYRYSFGNVHIGSNMYADFTLTAKPNEALEVKRITLSGSMYEAQSNCPAILNPGKTCTTRVSFFPRLEGAQWGRLVFSLTDNHIVIDLYGYGLNR